MGPSLPRGSFSPPLMVSQKRHAIVLSFSLCFVQSGTCQCPFSRLLMGRLSGELVLPTRLGLCTSLQVHGRDANIPCPAPTADS